MTKLIALSFLSLSAFAFAQGLEISALEVGTEFDTPTCSIETATGDSIFADPDASPAVMKLNGELVPFGVVPGMQRLWAFGKDGEKFETAYLAIDGSKVEISGVVALQCTPEQEGCEYTSLKIDSLKVTSPKGSAELTNLTGGCGV